MRELKCAEWEGEERSGDDENSKLKLKHQWEMEEAINPTTAEKMGTQLAHLHRHQPSSWQIGRHFCHFVPIGSSPTLGNECRMAL